MDLKELREKAKELGIKSAHLMKEDTLVEKIKEVSGEDVVPTFEPNKFMKDVEKAKKDREKESGGKYEFEVLSGKLFLGNNIYRKGDRFKSDKELDKAFNVKRI